MFHFMPKSIVKDLLCGVFSLVLIALTVVSVAVVFSVRAYGDEVALFPETPPSVVCLFAATEPVCLFPGFVIEQPVSAQAPADPVLLFEGTSKDPDHDSPNTGLDAFAWHGPAIAGKESRPVMYCYGPDWCVPCRSNFRQLGEGDNRLKIICVKGDETKFPKHIQEYADTTGYPVQHWTAPSGRGAMNYGTKSLDQLVELVKTEPNEAPAIRTRARRPLLFFPSTAIVNE
jgi:hypothetical protein